MRSLTYTHEDVYDLELVGMREPFRQWLEDHGVPWRWIRCITIGEGWSDVSYLTLDDDGDFVRDAATGDYVLEHRRYATPTPPPMWTAR